MLYKYQTGEHNNIFSAPSDWTITVVYNIDSASPTPGSIILNASIEELQL
jgi:hypothetical protein